MATPSARTGRWLVALAAVCLTLAALSGVAAAQRDTAAVPQRVVSSRPPLWSSSSAASAIHVNINTRPRLLPLDELIRLEVPYGQSQWSATGSSDALAATVYPGSSGVKGPSLLCRFAGGCPGGFPPDYPLAVTASYPTNPRASTRTGAATAHAGRDFVETSASPARLLAPALGPLQAVVSVGSARAHTEQHFDGGGATVVGAATAVLNDISLAGGIIHIDQLLARSISRSAGAGETEATNKLVVTGVTVAGQAAAITDQGIAAVGRGGDTAEATKALNDALQQLGVQIELLGTSKRAEGGTVTGSVRGLRISFELPLGKIAPGTLPNVPVPDTGPVPVPDPNSLERTYFGSVTLGLADSSAFVSNDGFGFDAASLQALGGSGTPRSIPGTGATGTSTRDAAPPEVAVSAPAGGATGGGSATSARPPSVATRSQQATAPAPAVATAPSGRQGPAVVLLGGASARGVANLYLAVGLVALLLFGLSRLPHRLLGAGTGGGGTGPGGTAPEGSDG